MIPIPLIVAGIILATLVLLYAVLKTRHDDNDPDDWWNYK